LSSDPPNFSREPELIRCRLDS